MKTAMKEAVKTEDSGEESNEDSDDKSDEGRNEESDDESGEGSSVGDEDIDDESGEGSRVDSPNKISGINSALPPAGINSTLPERNNSAVLPTIPPVITVQRKGAFCCGCGKDASKSNHYCIYTKKRVMVWCYAITLARKFHRAMKARHGARDVTISWRRKGQQKA